MKTQTLEEFIKEKTMRLRKWTKYAYDRNLKIQGGEPCLRGTRITRSSVENNYKEALQQAGEVAVREEREKIEEKMKKIKRELLLQIQNPKVKKMIIQEWID